jgi:hypothetical protein
MEMEPFTIREFVLLGFVVVLIDLLTFAAHRVQGLSRKLRQEKHKEES